MLSNNLDWSCLSLTEMKPRQLFELFKIRQEIFVIEQSCIYPDIDKYDLSCWHLLGYGFDLELHAYCRLLKPGGAYEDAIFVCSIKFGAQLRNDKVRGASKFIPSSDLFLLTPISSITIAIQAKPGRLRKRTELLTQLGILVDFFVLISGSNTPSNGVCTT